MQRNTDTRTPSPPARQIEPPGPVRLTPHALAFEGYAVARDGGGLVHFVEGALPGETVLARVLRRHAHHVFARVESVLTAAPARRDPVCPAFGRCGGCHLLHCAYAVQLEAKYGFVREALRRVPHIESRLEPITPSPEEFGYRNRIALSIDPAGVIGFHERDSADRLVSLPDCRLVPAWMNDAAHRLAALLAGGPRTDLFRLVLREGRRTGERLIWLQARHTMPDAASLNACFAGLEAGVVATTTHPAETRVLSGRGRLTERLGGLDYDLAPASFFQVNTAQAERLFERVLQEAARLQPRRIIEFYAGAGALTALLARTGADVTGVEHSPAAVRDAHELFTRHGLANARMIRCDAARFDPARAGGPFDLAVVDPPRTGLERDALKALLKTGTPHLFYISCHPATLARDLERLAARGYTLAGAAPFDMFPQSFHVETFAWLSRPA